MLILFIIGLPFLAGAAVTLVQRVMFVMGSTKAEATYTGSVDEIGGNHGGTFLHPQLRFTTSDGQVVSITSSFGSTGQPYGDGEKVPVLYDPRHPEHAEVESFMLWLPPLFLAPFGLLFCGIPALIFVTTRNRPSVPLTSRHIPF
ncbi:MAG TPA: DUF3592 domain-containing protein [Acetobacteraceae bacterium]